MGFNLSIGQLEKYINEDGNEDTEVKEVSHPNAPADGVPTDFTNKRWPSYTGWGDFMDIMGWEEDKLIPDHPGYVVIDKAFKDMVDVAYNLYRDLPDHGVRITWMKYWTDWALANCEAPVFHNT